MLGNLYFIFLIKVGENLNKRITTTLIIALGLIVGIVAAFMPSMLLLAFIAAVLFTSAMLLDYSKFLYVIGFYVILDYTFRYVIQVALFSSVWEELLIVFAMCLWLYKWFIYRKEDGYHWTPLDIPLVVFIVISISLLFIKSPIMDIGIAGLRQVVQQLIWYFIAAQLIRSSKNARYFLYIIVFIGGVIGLHGIYQYVTHAEMPSYWADQSEINITTRVFSIIGSPNILGALMVLILPVSISFIFSEKKVFKKIIFTGTALAMFATLIFTASRSAWIGFIAAMAVYFWLKDKRLIVLLVILIFAAYALSPTVSNRVNYMLSPEYWASSATGGRVARYTIAFEWLSQNPVFGVGLGWFGGAVAKNFQIPDAFYVDSYFLKIAVEMGLVGLGAFVYLIYNAIAWGARSVSRASAEDKSMAQGLLAGIVGVIIPNFVENVFEVPMMVAYFWIFAAILIYLGFTVQRGNKKSNELSQS